MGPTDTLLHIHTLTTCVYVLSLTYFLVRTRNTHTHKHKEHSQLSKQHKKALSLIPNIVNVDSTPTIIIVRAASRLYVDKRSIIFGIRIDFIKLYTLSLHDGFRRA